MQFPEYGQAVLAGIAQIQVMLTFLIACQIGMFFAALIAAGWVEWKARRRHELSEDRYQRALGIAEKRHDVLLATMKETAELRAPADDYIREQLVSAATAIRDAALALREIASAEKEKTA